MLTSIDKFLVSLLPLVTMIGGYFGADISPEWWQAVATAIAPPLVWYIANKVKS